MAGCVWLVVVIESQTKGTNLMKRLFGLPFLFAALLFHVVAPMQARAQYAAEVLSYTQGTNASFGFTSTPTAALGPPERFTGEAEGFPSAVSPFSPPFSSTELISIGQGGQITLRLSNFAIPQPSGPPEIGVFGNVGI